MSLNQNSTVATNSIPERESVMYHLTSVTKNYAHKGKTVRALDVAELSIPAGQMVAIQGPTGGGKSTLLQMLGALDRPTSGSITFGGKDLATLRSAQLGTIRAEKIGFIFQNFNLIPTLNAAQNVETALAVNGVDKAGRRERALEALAAVGLADRADHLPSELSGGQQQRVAIARALVKNPQVLLADEPTGNLDEAMRDEVMELLERQWREKNLTLIMVTHDSAVARRAQRRLRIAHGKVTEAK